MALSKKKKDKRIKNDYSDYPEGRKPTVFGTKRITQLVLEEDRKKHGIMSVKAYGEFILENFTQGNIKIKVPNTDLWVEIDMIKEYAHLQEQCISEELEIERKKQEKADRKKAGSETTEPVALVISTTTSEITDSITTIPEIIPEPFTNDTPPNPSGETAEQKVA